MFVFSSQISADLTHQFSHGTATMVSGDIGMEVSPDTFDAIVVGTIRRQKAKLDAAVRVGQRKFHLPTAVNPVVVQAEKGSELLLLTGQRNVTATKYG